MHIDRFPLALRRPDPNIRIRPACLDDIVQIHGVCWPERPPGEIQQLVGRALRMREQGRGLCIVVLDKQGGALCAYGQLTVWMDCAEISDLMVRETERARGIGTAMIQYLCQKTRTMGLDFAEIGVALSNPRALALYRRLGFHDHRTLQANLGNGDEPVLYLRLALK